MVMRIKGRHALILLGLGTWLLVGMSCNSIMSRMAEPTPIEDVDVTPVLPLLTSPPRLPATAES